MSCPLCQKKTERSEEEKKKINCAIESHYRTNEWH